MLILSSAVHVAEYCSPPSMTILRFFKWRLLEQIGKPRIYGKYTHNDHRMINLVANISWNQVVPRKPGLILQTTRLCSITSWKAKMPGSISASFPGSFPYLECGAGKDPGIGWSRATLYPEILSVINNRGLHNTGTLSVLSRLGSGFSRCNFPSFCL